MATPIRRRTAAPSADDYATPAAPTSERRTRSGRRSSAPTEAPKYTEDELVTLEEDDLNDLADEESLPATVVGNDAIITALLKITIPAPAAEPEPEEEPAPTRRRRAAPPEEEPAPARRGRAAPPEEDEEPSPRARRGRRSDTSDDEPSDAVRRSATRAGFKAYKEADAASAKFERNWTPKEEEMVVKFLDEGPFETYTEHSLFHTAADRGSGQRTFVCVKDDASCPLCAAGAPSRAKALFNVVLVDPDVDDDPGKLVVMEAGPGLAKVIEAKSKSRANGGLDGHYWSLYAQPKGNTSILEYYLEAVKTRDLEKDFNVVPFDEAALDDFRAKCKNEPVKYSSMSAMETAADLLVNG